MKGSKLFHALRKCLSSAPSGGTVSGDPDIARHQPVPYMKLQHPGWAHNATIYELNTRQFSAEGTFCAAQRQLPRLKDLGIVIVWLMPVHPIGVKNRKGTLGSPYSVRDYYAVNPEFGSLQDLKNFVAAAHELDMHVILDWVANHTAWDNPLVEQHPEWYERDWKGDFRPTPWWDWSDIIDLDYSRPEVRRYMTEAMKYWVQESDIDGYRCDVALNLPLDFWNNLRRELDEIKPVFMLAECDGRDIYAEAFDMGYAWDWRERVDEIVNRRIHHLDRLFAYYAWNERGYPEDAYRMTFLSNHDLNTWEEAAIRQYGEGMEAMIVLSVVGDGMPLLYNGDEAGNNKRLAFFEKDPIEWRHHPVGELYRKMFRLQHTNTALWHGKAGASMIRVWNDAPGSVLSFVRGNDRDKVFCLINFSARTQEISFEESLHHGSYREYLTGESINFTAGRRVVMPPWGYRVYVQ